MQDQQVPDDEEAESKEVAQLRVDLANAVAKYRDLLRMREDVVPDMVQGSTLEEVDNSLAAAQAAYAKMMEHFSQKSKAQAVSAGGGARRVGGSENDGLAMKPLDKIAAGLAQRNRG